MDAYRTGPFAPPFVHSLASLTLSLAPHSSLRSRAPLRLFVGSLAHYGAHGIAFYVYEFNASVSYSFNSVCNVSERKFELFELFELFILKGRAHTLLALHFLCHFILRSKLSLSILPYYPVS